MAVRAGTVGVLDGTDRTVQLVREAVRAAPARAAAETPTASPGARRDDRTVPDRTDDDTEKTSTERP
jgi:UDP-N-acetylglucosamine--N-acetylmuramyl-(pentapeptide) pyrophosphoryl-undecaprenol N-acetylglucosamine transferase